jgi:hypothetical protein
VEDIESMSAGDKPEKIGDRQPFSRLDGCAFSGICGREKVSVTDFA